MEKPPENLKEQIKTPEEKYEDLIREYQSKVREINMLQLRVPRGVIDEEIATAIRVIDEERHKLHLKIRELGKQFGKDDAAILVDIIRQQRTLEEYGLPEFSILKEDDVIDFGPAGRTNFLFNVDKNFSLPNNQILSGVEQINKKTFFSADKFMLVFAILPMIGGGYEDYDIRVKRARVLAKEMNGEFFEEWDSRYHTASVKVLGVILFKKDLERVASIIRNNPNKFRLGKEFYP